ncbi:MAG: ATPase domain-containing protein [Methanomassiliicoccales archaeon]
MAKRFECPRCGSGVRPKDTQCFRCGEPLQKDASYPQAPELPRAIASVTSLEQPLKQTVERSTKDYPSSISYPESPENQLKRRNLEEWEKALENKAKELEEREKAILASVEQLENDTKALEEALRRFEQEDAVVRERERLLKEKETALEEMSRRIEELTSHLAGQEHAGLIQEARRLKEMSESYWAKITEERRLQREMLDREIEERMERLRTLQGLINAASSLSVGVGEEEGEKEFQTKILAERESSADPILVQKAICQIAQEVERGKCSPNDLDMKVFSTHDQRLDQILGGGIPLGHVVIVSGGPGSMKSTLTYYIMYNAALKDGRRGMYFSLEQKRESLIRQMERMGMPRAPVQDRMIVVDMVDLRKAMVGEKGDWREILMRYVKNVYQEMPFDLFVLDSLESFKSMAQFEFDRTNMMDLFDWFKSLGITVMVIAEKPLNALECSAQGETYLADGVIEMLLKEFEDAKVHRWLRCVKMRGLQNDTRYYAFYHTGKEFKFSLPLVDRGN